MTKKNKPREYTEDEVREHFLRYVNDCINFWEKEARNRDVRGKLEGLAHSILVGIDGDTLYPIRLPKFILAPDPHPQEKDYSIGLGENYYPENHGARVKCDIGGVLHEVLHHYVTEE